MKVKELIKILETVDGELPIATHANNHSYFSDERADGFSHGSLKVAICHHCAGNHIIIGNPYKKELNPPNWYIKEYIESKK